MGGLDPVGLPTKLAMVRKPGCWGLHLPWDVLQLQEGLESGRKVSPGVWAQDKDSVGRLEVGDVVNA
jgi:hypothetical protein